MSRALAALSSHSSRQLFNLAEAMLLSHFTDGELQSRNATQAQGEGGNLQGRKALNPPLAGSILCVFCTSPYPLHILYPSWYSPIRGEDLAH